MRTYSLHHHQQRTTPVVESRLVSELLQHLGLPPDARVDTKQKHPPNDVNCSKYRVKRPGTARRWKKFRASLLINRILVVTLSNPHFESPLAGAFGFAWGKQHRPFLNNTRTRRRPPQLKGLQLAVVVAIVDPKLQHVPKTKVPIVVDLIVRYVGAVVRLQQAGALKDALVFTQEFVSSVIGQGFTKMCVKVSPRRGRAKGRAARVVEMVLFLLVEFSIPERVFGWIGGVVRHPKECRIRVVFCQSFRVLNDLLVTVRFDTKTANVSPHPIINGFLGGTFGK